MLVLKRRVGETLLFTLPTGEEIKVSIEDVKGQAVKIGIEAPRHVAVSRPDSLLRAPTWSD